MVEKGNTWTHLIGVIFSLSCIWMAWPAMRFGWQMALGVILFIAGMFLMFLSSTVYHCLPQGRAKDILRRCDHISIYLMIACSYSPLLIGVVGGVAGWLLFILQWMLVLAGAVYKILAINRYPRLSLAIYLLMGWSVLFVAPQVMARINTVVLVLLLAEGLFYTSGTWFFAHDHHPRYHAVWHVFVLLGAMAHTSAVLCLLFPAGLPV
ncbi:MAG: hemolysin III family protein [Bacteroidaceae bacterium]|nr:hemolysin III family protein [Bacteroidaceae bacterium]